MAKYRLHLVGLLLLMMTTCGSIGVTFTKEAEATIEKRDRGPLDSVLGAAGLDDLTFDTQGAEELRNEGIGENALDSVELKSVRVQVVDPEKKQDLSFFTKLEFFIESDGLPKSRIAHRSVFAAGQTSVELSLDDVELKPYVAAESMRISAQGSGVQPETDTRIRATFDLGAQINIAEACKGSQQGP